MKNHQLCLHFINNISDMVKAILTEFWDLLAALKPREIARKYSISESVLKSLFVSWYRDAQRCMWSIC